jgi:hypothetical protein
MAMLAVESNHVLISFLFARLTCASNYVCRLTPSPLALSHPSFANITPVGLNGYNLINTDPIRIEWAAVSNQAETQTHSPDPSQFRHEMPSPMPQGVLAANQMAMKSYGEPKFSIANHRKSSIHSFHRFWAPGRN